MTKVLWSFVLLSGLLSACGTAFREKDIPLVANLSEGITTPIVVPTPAPTQTPTNYGFCGPLDFTGMTWPTGLSDAENQGLALALNITGTFEGGDGWFTITNNFDGQGMSLGLFQQNFGVGTLQPLLISLLNTQPAAYQGVFASADLSSLTKMLADWQSVSANSLEFSSRSEDPLFPNKLGLNALDQDFERFQIQSATTNTASVTWATQNLYTSSAGTTFVARWKNSFQGLAKTAGYRSLQLQASLTLFRRAEAYFKTFRFTQLGTLLMMMDFVVQNGGFTSAQQTSFAAWDQSHAGATEAARATALLEIRLASVLDAYKADVQARKMLFLNGSGVVHETTMNLATDFCFTPGTAFTVP